MKIGVRSWHYTSAVSTAMVFKEKGVVPPELKINKSHFALPVEYAVERENGNDLTQDEVNTILGEAFDFFNWVHNDFAAPDEVNESACRHDTHASQSVGDLVEVEGYGFFMVIGIGWEKLALWDVV